MHFYQNSESQSKFLFLSRDANAIVDSNLKLQDREAACKDQKLM